METGTRTSNWRVAVWFDGKCPICRREIAHYRTIDRRHQIRFIDLSQDSRLLNALGVSTDTGMRRLHALRADGVVVDGAQAFVAMWRQLPGYRWLAEMLEAARRTAVADFIYERFARRRFRRYRRRAGGNGHCRSRARSCPDDSGRH